MAVILERLSGHARKVTESNFEDVQRLVYSTCHKFAKRYAQNVENCISEAQELFLKGDKAWQQGRRNSDTYSVHIVRWVWFGLFDTYRRESGYRRKDEDKRPSRDCRDTLALNAIPAPETQFNLVDFLGLLSCDAQYVARITLDLPPPLAAAADAKGGMPHNIRSTVRQYLAGLGWTANRINDAFDEIKTANGL